MSLPGISHGHGFPGYDEEIDEEIDEDEEEEEDLEDDDEADEDQHRHRQQHQRPQEGPPVRRRRLGSGTRLPGVAELDRTIAADRAAEEGARLIKREEPSRRIKLEHDRRGSGCSGASGGSRRSR